MTKDDLFGLDRERRILESGIRSIFTPHQPIHSESLFFGREEQVQKLMEHINTPGQHALLYGDRGVGKSSLANVTARLLLKHLVQGELYTKRCDSSTTFEMLVMEPLKHAGVDVTLVQRSERHKQGGKAGVKAVFAEGAVASEHETSRVYKVVTHDLAPAFVAETLRAAKGLLMIDEADAIPRVGDKKKLAELIKLLSDNGSTFKLLVVGIADTANDLTGGHPSVQRCLKETKLGRMPDRELAQIVEGGAAKARLEFDPSAVTAIVHLSSGYPHFTHLLALKCAEEAIASERTKITKNDLGSAIALAVQDAESSLRRMYDDAVRSYGTDLYKHIMLAAARIEGTEFTAEQLREAIQGVTGQYINQQALNNYLQRLVSDGPKTILRRVAKGVYRFNDPRMQSFIKLACGELT